MKRIGFSYNYIKLWNQTKAQLLQCVRIKRCEIDEDAIDYDTQFISPCGECGFYKLEDCEYLRLLLIGNKGIPFTTYRKYNAENRAKYMYAIGNWFEIYVKENAK